MHILNHYAETLAQWMFQGWLATSCVGAVDNSVTQKYFWPPWWA